MTREELYKRLTDIEWDDFEVKEAKSELPKSIWETVSAFSNTSGGWIVLGIQQKGKEFIIKGVDNADYFSPMHPTIRKYDNRIEFQNPGRFMFDLLPQTRRKRGLRHRQNAQLGALQKQYSRLPIKHSILHRNILLRHT